MINKIKVIYKNQSIKNKLILPFAILLALGSLFIYLYFPQKTEAYAIYSVYEKGMSIINITSKIAIPALVFDDSEALNETINSVKDVTELEYIFFTDEKGKLKSGFAQSNYYYYEYIKLNSSKAQLNDNNIQFRKDIIHNGQNIGAVHIGLSLETVNREITIIRLSIALISLSFFIIGFLAIFLISKYFVKHFNTINDTFKLVASSDFSQKINYESNDEIGALVNSFNSMVEKLDKAYKELQSEINFRKLTELKLIQAQNDVIKSLEHEKEINKLKTKFIAMVSHEYRTPLTVILTTTFLLETFFEKNLKQDFFKNLEVIRDSIKTMTQLLEDVLIIGRAEAGKLELRTSQFDFFEYLQNIYALFSAIDKQKHTIMFNSKIENPQIVSDKSLLDHIFNNILSNAIKYSPANTEIIIDLAETEDDFIVSVEDFGIGIPEEEQYNLFQAFFRANNTVSIPGTGLGLSIVKRCVDKLNGNIKLIPKHSNGCFFEITIPKISIKKSI